MNARRLRRASAVTQGVVLVFSAHPGTSVVASEAAETFDRLNPYGDVRLRAEVDEKPCTADRWRPRLRLRLGTNVILGNDVRAELRLTTGDPNDPRSPHQTFGSGGGKFSLSLDRACLHWSPSRVSGLQLTAGKFGSRLPLPATYGELAADADVQPTGILATWVRGSGTRPSFGIGSYLLDEQAAGGETHALVAQAGVRHGSDGGLQVSGSVDAFLLFLGDGTTVDKLGHPTGRGNLVRNNRFVSDFRVVHAFVEFASPLGGRPLTLNLGGVHNVEAATADDSGWFAGATLGRVSTRGTWSLFFQWQEVAQEAVFTPWSQDDWPDDRGSGFRGPVAGGEAGLSQRISLRLWVLASSPYRTSAAPDDCWLTRLRADVNARF